MVSFLKIIPLPSVPLLVVLIKGGASIGLRLVMVGRAARCNLKQGKRRRMEVSVFSSQKNSRNSDTFTSWRTFVASRIGIMDAWTSLSSNTSRSSDECCFPRLLTFRDKLKMASTIFCSVTYDWLFVDVVV